MASETLSRRRALAVCVSATVTAATCAALFTAAALAPAPVGVLPLVVIVCTLCPMVVAADLWRAIAVLRGGSRALADMRRRLDELPETPHPLGR